MSVDGIGAYITQARLRRGFSMGELATRTGLTTAGISLIERERRTPRLDTLHAIARALDVPAVTLQELAGYCTQKEREVVTNYIQEPGNAEWTTLEEIPERFVRLTGFYNGIAIAIRPSLVAAVEDHGAQGVVVSIEARSFFVRESFADVMATLEGKEIAAEEATA